MRSVRGGGEEGSLTHSGASRFSDPEEPMSERETAFGKTATVPQSDLDAFDF